MRKHSLKIIIGVVAVLVVIIAISMGSTTESSTDILISPQVGLFEVAVNVTGELQAKNSIEITGPPNARQARIWQMTINKLVPEGTVVKKGEFVADLDRSEITTRLKDEQLDLQKTQSSYTQTKLDTTLELSKARDNLVNLKYAMEEAKLKMEESIYEAPSVQRQAEINYEKAERAYEQAVNNYQTQVEQSKAKMSEVEADLQQAKDRLALYQDIVDEFTVRAPADGMVIYVKDRRGQKTTEGSQINAWEPTVASLPDLSVMESIVYISEVDIQKISEKQSVEIGLDAYPDKNLTGQVTKVANVGEQRPNSDSKVFEVNIIVNESDTTLRPAMTTSNKIIVEQVEDGMFVPLETIHTVDSLTFVYKKDGPGVIKQEVSLGLINENEAIIKEGLTKDDKIYLSIPENPDDIQVARLPGKNQPV